MTLAFYLGSSKYWWAYLGLKSNPGLLAVAEGCGTAVFFDDPAHLPSIFATHGSNGIQYFLVFWDGVGDPNLFYTSRQILGEATRLRAVVVGDSSKLPPEQTLNLYAEGALRFTVRDLKFDRRTSLELLKARLKTWTMPSKNLLQNRTHWREQLGLLLGHRRLVFCGSYGTIPEVMRSLCERHGLDFSLFADYPYYIQDPSPSLSTYTRYLQQDAAYLAALYTRSQINPAFLHSAVHLLGREYFVEQIRASGLPAYINGYATGVNVNVYTTPWYRQHVFPDFGSVVGTGNYPRLADLQYFRKRYVPIPLNDHPEATLAATLNGTLEQHFAALWSIIKRRLESALLS